MFTIFPEQENIAAFKLESAKRIKFGIDPTFPRLHLGHLVPLRLVKKLQEQGHDITIVLGTFTAQLGDPSGCDHTRPVLTVDEVKTNADAIAVQVKKLLHPGFKFFENAKLHNKIKLPQFLRIAANFTVAHMLSRDGFRDRMAKQSAIALHELLVPICQGLDSVRLRTEIEIGGQDQLFNFQIARQLQAAMCPSDKPQICFMTPIIVGTDGRKMSKSLGNCVFLDEEPANMFGKIMSISDAVMEEWFCLLSDLHPVDHPMQSKKLLAHDIVRQLHSESDANQALDNFERTIQRKEAPETVKPIRATDLIGAVVELRACSKSEARRLIDSKAVKLSDGLNLGSIIRIGRDIGKIIL